MGVRHRASAWQDQRGLGKRATARQALILHSTWKQKRLSPVQSQVSPGTVSVVTGCRLPQQSVLPLSWAVPPCGRDWTGGQMG